MALENRIATNVAIMFLFCWVPAHVHVLGNEMTRKAQGQRVIYLVLLSHSEVKHFSL